jgi:hypothetical protein
MFVHVYILINLMFFNINSQYNMIHYAINAYILTDWLFVSF